MTTKTQKQAKEIRRMLREFVMNGTQNYSRKQIWRFITERLEIIEAGK